MDVKLNMDAGEYLPLREVVFRSLREAILSGRLKPGERLMEMHLAQTLGVSRTPVREAIRKLELEGLAIMIPRKGAEVARITKKQLQDVLDVRKALEALAVQLACRHMTKDNIIRLERAHLRVKEMSEKKDVRAMVKADVHFHEIIYNAADNDKLLQILNNLRQQMYRYRLEYLKNVQNHKVIVQEHEMILEAVRTADEERAAGAMRRHIVNQEKGILLLMAEEEKRE